MDERISIISSSFCVDNSEWEGENCMQAKKTPMIQVVVRPYVSFELECGQMQSANGCHSSSGHSGGK